MKLRLITLTGFLLWNILAIRAQEDLPFTHEAIRLYEDGKLEEARLKAEEATKPGVEDKQPYAWYTKGFIYKEVFKRTDRESKFSLNRDIAIECINTCISLDKSGKYRSDCNEVLHWLAITFLQHAMAEIELSNEQTAMNPDMYYARYSALIRQVNPGYALDSVDVDFNNKMGASLGRMYERNPDSSRNLRENSIEYYSKALLIDSLNYDSNYNLAVTYFNEGVRNIRKINFETEIPQIIEIQDRCIRLFRQAEPFMIRAHNLRPDRLETLKGLYYLNRAMNNEEKASWYQSQIERLYGKQ